MFISDDFLGSEGVLIFLTRLVHFQKHVLNRVQLTLSAEDFPTKSNVRKFFFSPNL